MSADQGFYLMLRIIHRRSNMIFTPKRYGFQLLPMMSRLRCQYPGDRFPIHCTSQSKLYGVSTRLHMSICHGTDLSSWLYRIRPSVSHQGFTRLPDNPDVSVNDFVRFVLTLFSARVNLLDGEPESARQCYAIGLASVQAPVRQR